MSLRTKLLAVFVGLPGAILLLALALFIRAERPTPAPEIDRLIQLVYGAERIENLDLALKREQRRGAFRRFYVVREKLQDAEPYSVWTLEKFFDSDNPRMPDPDVVSADLRTRLIEHFSEAQSRSPPIRLSLTHVSVKLRPDKNDPRTGPDRPTWGIVAELHTARAGARTVYWVMIGGIALIMILSSVVVSRLVLRPLAKMSAAADRIADGDYQIALAGEDGADEIARTVRALNRMSREIGEYQGHLEDRVLSALGRIKKAEQHLAIAQRLAATGKLASGLAHEINNPLGGMKNAVRALARGDLSEERAQLYLDLIADGLLRVEQTVKKFLSFTPRSIEPHPVDVAEVAEKSVALAGHRLEKQRVTVETTLPNPGEAIVFGDPHELQQVALNLVLNAADAMEPGREGRIEVMVSHGPDEVVLRVTDNGSGMSTEDQDRCFDIFFTTKAVGEGSGMGLAVAHNIVTNHGGRIEVTSALGEGTTFQVFLPRESAASVQAQETPAETRP